MKRLGSVALAFGLLAFGARADESDDVARVQKDVREISHALYAGDVETVLRFTHPKILAATGEEAARKGIQDAVEKTKQLGMKVESLTFPTPPVFLEGGGRRFAVVPTLTIVSATGGQRIESLNFQLGVLEPEASHWTYVEGSRLTKENVQGLFPGFPSGYEFPPFYRKKL